MKKMLFANWKMFLNEGESFSLLKKFEYEFSGRNNFEVVIAPSMLYLSSVASVLKKGVLALGAQNLAMSKKDSLTGEVSAKQLKDIGCQYVLIGHSERRTLLGEENDQITQKISLAFEFGLTPVLCVGETLKEKNEGKTEAVLLKQLSGALKKVNLPLEKKIVIAYEPVWAIGSGTYLEVEEMEPIWKLFRRFFTSVYSEKFFDEKVMVLYGGSVNSLISPGFLSSKYCDGLLVGRASCDPLEFVSIASYFD